MANNWGYGPDAQGLENWHKIFPIACENRQSPVEINTGKAHYKSTLKSFMFRYDLCSAQRIVNTGSSFNVEFEDSMDKSEPSGGPLDGNYRLIQLHFHWGGRTNPKGSEHALDGNKYAAELHLVHWNTKYANFNSAMTKDDGLAGVGVFLQIGSTKEGIQKIVDTLLKIQTKGESSTFNNFNLCSLLPECLEYYTYPGSLTTPPLLECVIWIVLKQPIAVSHDQLSHFFKLYITSACERPSKNMENNWHPVQPLCGRIIRKSFK